MAAIKNLCAQISLDLHQWRGYAAVTTSRRPWYIAGKGYWRNTKRCGWGVLAASEQTGGAFIRWLVGNLYS